MKDTVMKPVHLIYSQWKGETEIMRGVLPLDGVAPISCKALELFYQYSIYVIRLIAF